MSISFHHTPVLLHETVDLLVTNPNGIYVDATCGLAGHSHEILTRLSPKGALYSFDLDPSALKYAAEQLSEFPNSHLIQNNYEKFKVDLIYHGVSRIDGILFDLGVSSMEIDSPERGFSFMEDGPLDMRMGSTDLTAAEVVNTYSREELTRIFRSYGEERYSGRIAGRIVESRPFHTTLKLKQCIQSIVSGKYANKTLARIFQAIRIEVNGELDALKRALDVSLTMLNPGGRLVVISYHSLEDRIVKQTFNNALRDCICPPEIPVCVCDHKATAKKITKKLILPSEEEIRSNPRSRSAKCRVIEKI